jgi:hypothetical protein
MTNLVDLTKKAGIVLEKKKLVGVQANIVLAIDRSGSMGAEYRNGVVQEVVDRLLGIGMNMDSDKSIDVFQFNSNYNYVGQATEGNYSDFVKKNGQTASGGTNYAPVMEAIIEKYGTPLSGKKKGMLSGLFGKKVSEAKPQYPTFVFFITDGDNFDKSETINVVKQSAEQPIFWQFVGIGHEGFPFLQKLDDLSGRYVDNADFFKVSDISKVGDDELYEKLLNEFPEWLVEVKSKGMLA